MKNQWPTLMDGPVPPEIESTFRVAALALFSGADQGAVSNYLKMAANQRRQECQERQSDAKLPWRSIEGMADLYDRMRQMHAAARVSTEAKILRNLAVQIKKLGRR